MEPFTLTIWLWMGARFEETQIPNMGRGECVELKMTIESDRGHGRTMKGQCIGAGGCVLSMDRRHPCARVWCGWPLPGSGGSSFRVA